MRKVCTTILGLLCVVAVAMATFEAGSGSGQILWSGGCILVAVLLSKVLDRMGAFNDGRA